MLRFPLLLAALAVLLLPTAGSLAAPTGSGGALAEPVQQGSGGGHAAPAPPAASEASAEVVDDDVHVDGGVEAAVPSQEPDEETRATPEGGQPNGDGPQTGTDDGAGGEESTRAVGELGESGGEGGGEVSGFLPSTGLRLAALAAVGVALLTAGLALRPAARS